jgi:hypothetical protein
VGHVREQSQQIQTVTAFFCEEKLAWPAVPPSELKGALSLSLARLVFPIHPELAGPQGKSRLPVLANRARTG